MTEDLSTVPCQPFLFHREKFIGRDRNWLVGGGEVVAINVVKIYKDLFSNVLLVQLSTVQGSTLGTEQLNIFPSRLVSEHDHSIVVMFRLAPDVTIMRILVGSISRDADKQSSVVFEMKQMNVINLGRVLKLLLVI